MTTSQFLRSVQVLAIAFIVGQALFIGITFFLTYNHFSASLAGSAHILTPIAAILTILAVWGNQVFYKKEIEKSKSVPTLSKKLEIYKSAFILRYAILDGPSILSIIFYLLSARPSLLFFSVILILIQIQNFPRAEKIILDLELNAEHQKYFNNPDLPIN